MLILNKVMKKFTLEYTPGIPLFRFGLDKLIGTLSPLLHTVIVTDLMSSTR